MIHKVISMKIAVAGPVIAQNIPCVLKESLTGSIAAYLTTPISVLVYLDAHGDGGVCGDPPKRRIQVAKIAM